VTISAWPVACGGDAVRPGITDSGTSDASLSASPDSSSGASPGLPSGDAEAASDALALACPHGGTAAGPLSTTRVPRTHRPAGSACPQVRAATTPVPACACPADGGACPCGACGADSDCTKGPNGRCEAIRPVPYRGCSYDECFADSDCAGGEPCQCRGSSESEAPNECLRASQCAVDSDCGPGGYCSPSVLSNSCQCQGSSALCADGGGGCYEGSNVTGPPPGPGWTEVPCLCGDTCGHGYFCHTPCDACVDDSDCTGQATCNYDVVKHIWACAECVGIP
jgi:hypothetical protein